MKLFIPVILASIFISCRGKCVCESKVIEKSSGNIVFEDKSKHKGFKRGNDRSNYMCTYDQVYFEKEKMSQIYGEYLSQDSINKYSYESTCDLK